MDPKIKGVHYYSCDVSSPTQVTSRAQEILRDHQPTMLVNNAGIVVGKKFIDASVEEMQRYPLINDHM
jgi:short-subunit dehydrogenase